MTLLEATEIWCANHDKCYSKEKHEQLGQAVRKARENLEITMKQLSQKSNVPYNTIVGLQTVEHRTVSSSKFNRINSALGNTLTYWKSVYDASDMIQQKIANELSKAKEKGNCVVYVITCKHCGKSYIGMTSNIIKRIQTHLEGIAYWERIGIAKHPLYGHAKLFKLTIDDFEIKYPYVNLEFNQARKIEHEMIVNNGTVDSDKGFNLHT